MAFLHRLQKLKLLFLTSVVAAVMLLTPVQAWASTYGSGGYNDCAYNVGCPSGGSSSTPSGTTTPEEDKPGDILLNDFNEYFSSTGKQLTLEPGQSVHLDMVTEGVKQNYTITVGEVGEDFVNLTFSTDSLNGRLNVGETKEYDLNGDGKNDISITLNSITDGKANLTYKTVLGASTTTQPNSSTPRQTQQPEKRSWLGLIFSILAILIALFIFFILWRRRRKRDQQPGPWKVN